MRGGANARGAMELWTRRVGDGTRYWTSDRQAGFISLLFATGCVAHAAAAVGMSREGAYRLRARDGAFAEGWDVVLAMRARQAAHRRHRAAGPAGHTWGHTPRPATTTKGHTASAGKGSWLLRISCTASRAGASAASSSGRSRYIGA